MSRKNIKVLFYTINLPESINKQTFSELFDSMFNSGQQDRTAVLNGVKHRVRAVSSNDYGWIFAIARERAGDWPYWMRDEDTELSHVSLADGTLGEATFFWVMPRTGLLLELFCYHGPSQATLRNFLLRKATDRQLFLKGLEFGAVFEREVYQRFLLKQRSRKIQFKYTIAGIPRDAIDQHLADSDLASALHHLAHSSDGLDISVEVSAGRGLLRHEKIKAWAQSLVSSDGTKKAVVYCAEDNDDKLEPLDLLGGRLKYFRTIHHEGNYLEPSVCIQHLEDAYLENRDYLLTFGA